MSLDRRTIVAAALELLEESGVEGVSTRKLADRLGVKGPSLYWHFHNKNELLSHMAGAMFTEALPPSATDSGPDFDWAEWLAEGARGIRRVALSRRDGAVIMTKTLPVDVAPEKARELMRATLMRHGFSENDAHLTLVTLGRFALAWVLYEQTAAPRQTAADDEGFEYGLQVFLAGLKKRQGKG